MRRRMEATDDFEVTWDDPADAEQSWQIDREHHHGVMTRFELDASDRWYQIAMSMPGVAVNGRLFSSRANFKFPAPPRELRSRHFREIWSDIYRPAALARARELLDRRADAMGGAPPGGVRAMGGEDPGGPSSDVAVRHAAMARSLFGDLTS